MKFSRRMFLRGTGGAVLSIPFLESLLPREARAQVAERPRFAVFMRQANGCSQAGGGEPEMFWPRNTGTLTEASLSGVDKDRAVSELSPYASKLLLVAGLKFNYPGNGCGHSGGGNQCLTAARVSSSPSGNRSLALGESVDNRIARELNPAGRDPLTLYAGRMSGYIDEVLSYRGSMDLRPAENNPWNAYSRMTELSGGNDAVREQIASARLSVNDLVREQMQALMGNPRLSTEDRDRLKLHFESVREFETQLACTLPQPEIQEMQTLAQNDAFRNPTNIEKVAQLQADLIALAFACDYSRAATLQIGDGNDGTEYYANGVKLPRYHWISHRINSDGSEGTAIEGAQEKHHQIDRIHARMFRHLLDRLSSHGVLDDTCAVWTNDLAHGVSHSYSNVPFVIAGSSGGYLKTGVYVDVRQNGSTTPHNRLFNTILNAVGVRKADGSLVDDFGDPSLPKGELAAIKA
ncbi:MAG: DUF1552 domain-containing protein [Myxococcaceae bacterium]